MILYDFIWFYMILYDFIWFYMILYTLDKDSYYGMDDRTTYQIFTYAIFWPWHTWTQICWFWFHSQILQPCFPWNAWWSESLSRSPYKIPVFGSSLLLLKFPATFVVWSNYIKKQHWIFVQAIIPAVESLLDDCIAEDPKKAWLCGSDFPTQKSPSQRPVLVWSISTT